MKKMNRSVASTGFISERDVHNVGSFSFGKHQANIFEENHVLKNDGHQNFDFRRFFLGFTNIRGLIAIDSSSSSCCKCSLETFHCSSSVVKVNPIPSINIYFLHTYLQYEKLIPLKTGPHFHRRNYFDQQVQQMELNEIIEYQT